MVAKNSQNKNETNNDNQLMVAENDHEIKKEANQNIDSAAVGKSPSYSKSQPKCIINISEILGRAKCCAHLIKQDTLFVDLQKLKKTEKKELCQSS